ncbi:MAG: hypothetical protein GY867_07010, partial [bacterium]|nr:hypothetical protein [bacterium]
MKLEARHYTFIGLAVAVVAAMLVGYQPEVEPSPDSVRMHEYIESLPEGSVVMISFDHEASSLPEIRPLAVALLRHVFAKNLRPVG